MRRAWGHRSPRAGYKAGISTLQKHDENGKAAGLGLEATLAKRASIVFMLGLVVCAVGCGNRGDERQPVGEGAPVIAAGETFVCVSESSLKTIRCWGPRISSVPDGHEYQMLVTGRSTLCGLTVDREVHCREVRKDGSGQLRIAPSFSVNALRGASFVAMDFDGLCGVADGVRRCIRFPVERRSPSRDGPGGLSAVSGPRGGCVLTTGGDVECDHWGGRFTPRTIALVASARKVVATEQRGCARLVTRQVQCWLNSGLGPDGLPAVGPDPELHGEFDGALDIAISAETVCAAMAYPRRVLCSGSPSYGALGDGTYREFGQHRVGVRVKDSDGISHLVGGEGYFCGAGQKLEVTCWGFNQSGVLGEVGDQET
jgi:hypothetical protein